MRVSLLFILVFAFLVYTSVSCTSESDSKIEKEIIVVAKIGNDYSVTFDDLHKYVVGWLYYRKYREKPEAYNKALNDLINNQLKRIDFFERGLDKNKTLIKDIRRSISEELTTEYFESVYLGKYTTEEFAREAYTSMGNKVVYQQIVLNKPKDSNSKELETLKEFSIKIKNEIDNAANFEKLVALYSQDDASKIRKGYMTPLGWEESLSNNLYNTIFKLKQNEVQILDSENALYIIKVKEIQEISVEPFTEIKDEIIAKIKKAYYETSLEEYEKDKQNLIDRNSLKWNSEALKEIAEWSRIKNFYKDNVYLDFIQNEIDNGNNKTIIWYNGGKIDYKEYLRLSNEVLILKETENTDEKAIRNYVYEAILSDLIVKKDSSLGLEKKIFNAYTSNPILSNKITILYNQGYVENQIPEPNEGILKKFFDENQDSIFYQLEKLNFYALIYSDKIEAEKMWTEVEGKSIKDVSNRWLVKTYIRNKDGSYKTFGNKETPFLAEEAFLLKVSEVAGPFEYQDPIKGKQFAIIECVAKRPEQQLTYGEVQDKIKEIYLNYYKIHIDKKIIKELREKYKVQIFEDVLSTKIAALK